MSANLQTKKSKAFPLLCRFGGLCLLISFARQGLCAQEMRKPSLANNALPPTLIVDKKSTVSLTAGNLQGAYDKLANIYTFKGIPFATPPVGELRWQAPQAVNPWQNTKNATKFADQCMQLPLYSDMLFRSSGVSEDCLYLNVWTPALKTKKLLPVLLYFYGGGFHAGDGSEPRYDGTSFAQEDVVMITANYRLGLFGMLAHSELSAETEYSGSGNYTFMDQAAALQWVVDNIAEFGGDPSRITIGGESAGSLSVNALMVSPLSKHNIAGAIGESGSLLGPTLASRPLSEAEQVGSKLSAALGGDTPLSLKALRAMPAQQLLDSAKQAGFEWFLPAVDGYVFPESPLILYQNNQHAKVPLLAGNNSQEGSYGQILGTENASSENYLAAVKKLYPNDYEKVLSLYSGNTSEEIKDAAQALASDRFISFSTWNWADLVAKGDPKNVYYYAFSKVRPPSITAPKGVPSSDRGAVHSAEIEYALGNLTIHPAYYWDESDYAVSALLQQYFVNFVKTGNPNEKSLPKWPLYSEGKQLNINVNPEVQDMETINKRGEFQREFYNLP